MVLSSIVQQYLLVAEYLPHIVAKSENINRKTPIAYVEQPHHKNKVSRFIAD